MSTLGVIGFVLLGFVVGLASGFRLAIIRYRHIHRALVQNIYGVRNDITEVMRWADERRR